MKHMLLYVSVALGVSLSAAPSGHAFSIGEIKVQSYLHTPFVAEVPLHLKPIERGQGVTAAIGDERDYEAEGATHVAFIETLRPSIIKGPPDVIRIISTQPVEVPTFDLLLLVGTGQVTIVKHFAVALTPDPRSAPIMAETAPSGSSPTLPMISDPARPEAAWLAHLPVQYGPILRGEMLYKVMDRLHVPEPYKWQVAVRIWERNQERFIRGNLHGLQIGAYLDVPQDLPDSLPRLSPREAQQIVAEQWDTWQKPADMIVASASVRPADTDYAAAFTPAAPLDQSPDEAHPAEVDMSTPVNRAALESILQGFERRLEQRLSLPGPTAPAPGEPAVTFVSAGELQTALQGLEARLLQRLDTGLRPAGAWQDDTGSNQPSWHAGMETALASFLSADSWVYVLMVQNVMLLAIGAGIAWRWYRKRAAGGEDAG